jgi:hypothetical protein
MRSSSLILVLVLVASAASLPIDEAKLEVTKATKTSEAR